MMNDRFSRSSYREFDDFSSMNNHQGELINYCLCIKHFHTTIEYVFFHPESSAFGRPCVLNDGRKG